MHDFVLGGTTWLAHQLLGISKSQFAFLCVDVCFCLIIYDLWLFIKNANQFNLRRRLPDTAKHKPSVNA